MENLSFWEWTHEFAHENDLLEPVRGALFCPVASMQWRCSSPDGCWRSSLPLPCTWVWIVPRSDAKRRTLALTEWPLVPSFPNHKVMQKQFTLLATANAVVYVNFFLFLVSGLMANLSLVAQRGNNSAVVDSYDLSHGICLGDWCTTNDLFHTCEIYIYFTMMMYVGWYQWKVWSVMKLAILIIEISFYLWFGMKILIRTERFS